MIGDRDGSKYGFAELWPNNSAEGFDSHSLLLDGK